MDLKPGKLYKCTYCLLIYPTKEVLMTNMAYFLGEMYGIPVAYGHQAGAAYQAISLSKRLDCQVRYSKPGEIFMVLGQSFWPKKDEIFLHVLFGEKQEIGRSGPTLGWIVYKNWLKIVGAQEKYVI